jgi:hypothetical protein
VPGRGRGVTQRARRVRAALCVHGPSPAAAVLLSPPAPTHGPRPLTLAAGGRPVRIRVLRGRDAMQVQRAREAAEANAAVVRCRLRGGAAAADDRRLFRARSAAASQRGVPALQRGTRHCNASRMRRVCRDIACCIATWCAALQHVPLEAACSVPADRMRQALVNARTRMRTHMHACARACTHACARSHARVRASLAGRRRTRSEETRQRRQCLRRPLPLGVRACICVRASVHACTAVV